MFFLDNISGFILDKTIAVNSPKRLEKVKILIANTCMSDTLLLCLLRIFISLAMDTDKIKIFGARVKVDGTGKLAELERAEKVTIVLFSSSEIKCLQQPLGKNESQSGGYCSTRDQLLC